MKLTLLILSIFLFIHTTNAQWTIKHLDEDSGYAGTLKFKDDSLGLFMGFGSTIYKTTDIGETWNKIPITTDVNINDFQFIGDSIVVAIGDHYPSDASKLIKSKNLGENWDSISTLTGKQLFSLWFFNNDSGVVAGYDGIYRTVNSGSSWDTVWSVTQFGYKFGEVRQIFFPSSDIGYAVGVGYNQSSNPSLEDFLLKSTDSGVNWDTIITFENTSLSSVFFVNQDLGFIGTESGLIFKTTDAGNTWNEKQISNSRNDVKSIQFLSETKGFATGGTTYYLTSGGGSNFFISKTIDGGENWISYDTTGVSLNSIYFINDTTGFVSGDNGLIMKSNGQINKLPENYPWHLVIGTGVNDNKLLNSNIKVYPNPTSGILHIQRINSNKEIEKINLINASGQMVNIGKYDTNNQLMQLNLSNLTSGIYLLKVEYLEQTETMKIIKK